MSQDFYRHQSELLAGAVAESDVVITTAAIPGRKAPVLISQAMVQRMRFGSVVVDLAAERGGNCELTRPGAVVEQGGVTIAGPVNLPSSVPYHASQMYSRNIGGFLRHIAAKGQGGLDLADEIIAATLVTRDRKVIHPQVREALEQMRSAAGKGC
jgi:NAD(P) transhydrogenase subunit alpha